MLKGVFGLCDLQNNFWKFPPQLYLKLIGKLFNLGPILPLMTSHLLLSDWQNGYINAS